MDDGAQTHVQVLLLFHIIFTERFLSFVAGTRLTCCRTSEPTSEAAWMEKQPSLVKKNRSQRRSALTAFIAHILDFSTGAGSTILQNFSGSQDGWKTGRIQALQPQEVTNGQSYGSSNMFGTLTQGFKICFNTVCSIYNRPKLIKQSNFGWFHGTPSWWNSHIYIYIIIYIYTSLIGDFYCGISAREVGIHSDSDEALPVSTALALGYVQSVPIITTTKIETWLYT